MPKGTLSPLESSATKPPVSLGSSYSAYHFNSPSPPISRLISSIRSSGNGGDETGFMASDISFMGLSSAAIRLELNAPHRHGVNDDESYELYLQCKSALIPLSDRGQRIVRLIYISFLNMASRSSREAGLGLAGAQASAAADSHRKGRSSSFSFSSFVGMPTSSESCRTTSIAA